MKLGLRRTATLAAGVARGLLDQDRLSYGVFLLTDDCNARCAYCFNTRLPHLHGGERPAGESLSVEEYGRIASHLRPLFQAVFGGGEPFLRRDIAAIAQAFYRNAGTRLFSIPTNGSIPSTAAAVAAMAQGCTDAVFNIQVSLDAVGERHDALRRLPGGFDKAVSLCRALRRIGGGVNLVVNTVVAEETVADAAAVRGFLDREFGADAPPHNVQYDQRLLSAMRTRPELRAQAAALAPRDSWVERWYVGKVNALIDRQLAEDRMLYACNAGRKLGVVLPDGTASACEPFLLEPHYADKPRFNLRDYGYDFKALQAAPAFRAMARDIDAGACRACPWSCAAISSLTYSPRNWKLLFS